MHTSLITLKALAPRLGRLLSAIGLAALGLGILQAALSSASEISEPLAAAEQVVASTRAIEDQQADGRSLRIFGRTRVGRADEARAAFQRSIELRDGRNPYEATGTRLFCGTILASGSEWQRVGAQRDLTDMGTRQRELEATTTTAHPKGDTVCPL